MPDDGALVILLDVDNTLLDNDAVKADIDGFLAAAFDASFRARFWQVYEEVRRDLDVVSFPVTLQRLRGEAGDGRRFRRLVEFLMRYRFRRRLYPGVPAVMRRFHRAGLPVILSDGDPWFQAKKITDAGLGRMVNGNVLIFLHKEAQLDEVRRWYPAGHYAFFDDKPRLVAEVKRRLGELVTAVWVRQGSYAGGGWGDLAPPPDLVLEAIGDAVRLSRGQLLGRRGAPAARRPAATR
jgi:hypothetical protein